MGEFEDKLNGILNNPQEMEKIMQFARGFMGGGESAGGTPDSAVPNGAAAPTTGGAPSVEGLLGGLDPGLLKKLAGGLAGGVGTGTLLQAVTPHLKDERKGQLKRAITIAQMVKVAKGYFSE